MIHEKYYDLLMIKKECSEKEANTFLPFSRPSISMADVDAVVEVLRSGWITTGATAAEFEQQFAKYCGCEHAVALSSATGGMHLLLHALGIGPGDEVITPSLTWVSTVNLITACGATPVFVDVERHTLMTSAELIKPFLNERTRLIIPVHFAGASLALDPLRDLAAQYGLPLVEDAAHAVGTKYHQSPIGNVGTAIFSLHPIKNITTGEGGLFCTDDDALAIRMRRLKFHGLGVDAFDRENLGRTLQAEVLEPGFKYNMPDMNAALGLGQLARLETLNGRRAELAARYFIELLEVEAILPLSLPDHPMQHSWNLFVVRLDTERAGMSRDEFMMSLKNRGIGTGLHFRAVHRQKYYREKMSVPRGRLPNTEWNSERILSLPMFPDMQDTDVTRVVAGIKSVLVNAKV